jgi:ferric-dicitrate binding protein FerR (iron transport regulator)
MRSVLQLLVLAVGLLMATITHAAPLATVEAVQAPAWLERAGKRIPLSPGAALHSGDTVLTGPEARTYLLLADGSRVKLGESARFALHSRSTRPTKVLHGALDIMTGAFRFTTGALKRATERNLQIRVGTATIGIRGTDIWGKSGKERDIVALLEGRIEVTRSGETVELAEPMTYLDAPRSGDVLIRPLESGQLNRWARETEILPGDGAAHQKGRWRVQVAVASTQDDALVAYDKLREAGFDARIRPFKTVDATDWQYAITLTGFADRKEAAAVAERLAGLGFTAMVGR